MNINKTRESGISKIRLLIKIREKQNKINLNEQHFLQVSNKRMIF